MIDRLAQTRHFIFSKLFAFQDRKRAISFKAATDLLIRKFGPDVRLEIDGNAVGGVTYPCQLLGGPEGAPSFVFLKRARPGAGTFNPLDTDPQGPSCRLFNDWAGLQFMNFLFSGDPCAPEWLAGDRTLGFFVSGKAGESSLTDLLNGKDPGRAERGLLHMGKLLGRMHAMSVGRRKEYETLRFALGPAADRRDIWGTGPWMRGTLVKLRANFANIGFGPSERFYQDLDGVAAALENPGPFLAFTHNDLGPENMRFSVERPYLLDFEFADFRHAMTDGAYIRMLFPTCWRVQRVPEQVVSRMEKEYRTALAEGCPAACEDDLYQRAFLDGCAYWLAVSLRFALEAPQGRSDRKSAIDGDKKWGNTSLRQIIYGRVGAFLDASAGACTHTGIRETCLRLRDHLSRIWGLSEDRVPIFPAFQSQPVPTALETFSRRVADEDAS